MKKKKLFNLEWCLYMKQQQIREKELQQNMQKLKEVEEGEDTPSK